MTPGRPQHFEQAGGRRRGGARGADPGSGSVTSPSSSTRTVPATGGHGAGTTLAVPLGTGTPGQPIVVNPVRPSRTALEVGSLPVAGWLVEIEVVAQRADKHHR